MNKLCVILHLLVSLLVSFGNGEEDRQRSSSSDLLIRKPRALLQLGQVMACATRIKDVFGVLDVYNCYGCYCGKGGEGTPVDGIDRCCYSHDQCYGDREKSGVCSQLFGDVYLQPYEFDCVSRTESTERAGDQQTTTYWPQCTKAPTKCGQAVCQCDVQFANCIRRYKAQGKKKCGTTRFCI